MILVFIWKIFDCITYQTEPTITLFLIFLVKFSFTYKLGYCLRIMGGVCSGGTKEKKTKLEEKTSRGFSGKLKSKTSFSKPKGNSDTRSYANGDGFDKGRQRHDSGDFGLQFSRELKPSTPARTADSKVLIALTN